MSFIQNKEIETVTDIVGRAELCGQ